jgi:hypothetical protein
MKISIRRPSSKLFFTIFTTILILASCIPASSSGGNSSNQGGNSGGVQIDIIDVPDLSHLEVVRDFDIYADVAAGWITVEKKWTITPQDYALVSGDIPFVFHHVDAVDFSKPVPLLGWGIGSFEIVIHGSGPGGTCTITTIGHVDLELKGAFYGPPNCTLAFEIREKWRNATLHDECSSGLVLETTAEQISSDLNRDLIIDLDKPFLKL